MKQEQLERTIGLISEEGVKKLSSAMVLVCGLGGVGGTALEALARSGVGNFLLIDFDKVSYSNLNRQILYTANDVNKDKVEVAKKRLLEINCDSHIAILNKRIDNSIQAILKDYPITFIVDAIDDINGKIALADYALKNNIPIISSLGMANRMDSTKVVITRLDKTTDDPLARKLRYEYKQAGLDTKLINVVYSLEKPQKDGNKLNSMMMVPSSAGLAIASYVIKEIINQ